MPQDKGEIVILLSLFTELHQGALAQVWIEQIDD